MHLAMFSFLVNLYSMMSILSPRTSLTSVTSPHMYVHAAQLSESSVNASTSGFVTTTYTKTYASIGDDGEELDINFPETIKIAIGYTAVNSSTPYNGTTDTKTILLGTSSDSSYAFSAESGSGSTTTAQGIGVEAYRLNQGTPTINRDALWTAAFSDLEVRAIGLKNVSGEITLIISLT